MKRWFSIVFFVGMVAFSACNHPVETRHGTSLPTDVLPELSAIDSLMWQRPDSALRCLLPYFDTCTSHDCHYANLLLAELLYKNDNPQLNRAELLQAVDYYDSLCCIHAARHVSTDPILMFLDARAHYINGVGYYERDSVVEACQEYLKALEVMEDCFDEVEIIGNKANLTALLFAHLTGVFSDQYLHEQSIYFGNKTLKYFKKYDAISWNVSWVLNEIGSHYDVLGDYDSAGYYYNQGLFLLSDTNNLNYRDLTTRLAFLSYKKEKNPILSLNQLFSMLSQAESKQEYISRCLTIGEIYYHEKEFDSAWLYLNNVYDQSQNIGAKKQAAEWLVEICKAQNNMQDMHKFAEFLVPFANREENQSEVKSRLTEFYNSYRQGLLARQHQQKVKKITTMGVVVISILIFGLLVYFVLYHTSRRRKQHLVKQIEEEKHSHEMKQRTLSGRLKQRNEEMRELKDQVKRQDELDATPKQAESFIDEPICRLILERVKKGQFKSKVDYLEYKDFALSKQQLFDLRVAADQHFDLFSIRLKNAYPQLTNGDLDYCCLYLLGLTNADLAALMQRAYNTIVERDGKLKKIFGYDNPLPITLKRLAKNHLSI